MTAPTAYAAPPVDGSTKDTYHVEVWKQRVGDGQWTLYATCNGLGEAQQEVRWFCADAVHPSEVIKRFKIFEVKTTAHYEELRF